MSRWRVTLTVVLASVAAAIGAQQAPRMLPVEGNVSPVHDPVLARHRDAYYLFVTGGRNGRGVLPIRRSPNLLVWEQVGFVFPDSLPAWTATEVPRASNAWAPDISFFRGRYHLYYSVSSFGSRDSAIGLATNRRSIPRVRTTRGSTRAWSSVRLPIATTGTPSIRTLSSRTTATSG
jgi:beta-xylosidase